MNVTHTVVAFAQLNPVLAPAWSTRRVATNSPGKDRPDTCSSGPYAAVNPSPLTAVGGPVPQDAPSPPTSASGTG